MQAAALARGGDSAAASVAMGRALEGIGEGPVSRIDLIWTAFGLAILGRTEQAIDQLERMPRGAYTWAMVSARFVNLPLAANPRYQRMIELNRPAGATR
jgi:hypothetical protein